MNVNNTDLPGVILTLVIAGTILFTGTYLASATIDVGDTSERVENRAVLLNGNQYVTIDDTIGRDETVVNSAGYAVNLSGADDSYVKSSQSINIASDDTWTAATWARVDGDATGRNMTAVSVNGRIIFAYNGSAGNWTAWYHDDGTRYSYRLTADAPSPTALTQLQLIRNDSTLQLERNDTVVDSANLTVQSSAPAPTSYQNFDGRLDELRVFDDALTGADGTATYTDPVDPRPQTNRTARVMFDQPSRDEQLLLFTNGQMETSNVTYSDGLAGSEMDEGEFANLGADYKWRISGPQIKPIDNGELDGAPVAYVSYDSEGALGRLAGDWTQAVVLAALLFVILPLGVIITYLRDSDGITARGR